MPERRVPTQDLSDWCVKVNFNDWCVDEAEKCPGVSPHKNAPYISLNKCTIFEVPGRYMIS